MDEGKAQAPSAIQNKKKKKKKKKKKTYVLNCCSNIFEYEPSPSLAL